MPGARASLPNRVPSRRSRQHEHHTRAGRTPRRSAGSDGYGRVIARRNVPAPRTPRADDTSLWPQNRRVLDRARCPARLPHPSSRGPRDLIARVPAGAGGAQLAVERSGRGTSACGRLSRGDRPRRASAVASVHSCDFLPNRGQRGSVGKEPSLCPTTRDVRPDLGGTDTPRRSPPRVGSYRTGRGEDLAGALRREHTRRRSPTASCPIRAPAGD